MAHHDRYLKNNKLRATYDKYLHVYRFLRNGTVVRLFDLTREESSSLEAVWTPDTLNGYNCFVGPDQKVLIKFHDDENIIYESKDTFHKIVRVGIRSSFAYFMYCPSPFEFMNKKQRLIQELFDELGIVQETMDYTRASLQRLESALMDHHFKDRQVVERYFLGILAYCGETLCHVLNAKWYIQSKDPLLPDPYWNPLMEVHAGLVLDSFLHLHESLLAFDGNKFLLMLHLVTDEAQARRTAVN